MARKGPTPDFDQVVLKWAGVNLDGTPCTGKLELSYNRSTPMLDPDATFPVSIYPTLLTQVLTTAVIQVEGDDGALEDRTVGYASWRVPATDDDDIQGSGGTYTLTERLDNGRGVIRTFIASKDAPGGVIWLPEITSVTPVPGEAVSAVSVSAFGVLKGRVDDLELAPGGPGGNALTTYTQVAGLNDYPTGFPPAAHNHPLSEVTGVDDYIDSVLDSAVSGKADLGVDGKLNPAQLPDMALSQYKGVVASNAAMLALTAQIGDFVSRTDSTVMGDGIVAKGDWILTSNSPSVLADWHRLSGPSSGVTSVNGVSGPAVTLTSEDLTEGATRKLLTVAERAAIAANTAAFGGTPIEVRAASGGNGAYPARPATTRPVHFLGANPPAPDGSVTGGGGMVPSLDSWFWWST